MDIDNRRGYLCPECRLLVSATTEQMGASLVCPCCHTVLRVPKEDDDIPLFGDSMRTQTVSVSLVGDQCRSESAWRENLPSALLAEHARGLPWHMLLPASIVGLVLYIGLMHVLLDTNDRPVRVLTSSIEQAQNSRSQASLGSDVSAPVTPEEVQTYLDTLADCQTVDQLQPYLRPVPELRKKLENYYAGHALHFDKVDTVYDVSPMVDYPGRFLFSASFAQGKGRLGVIFKQGDRLFLDWASFVGYCDIPWEQIKTQKSREPFTIRAIRSTAEYYNHGFDSENYRCFELTRNDSNETFYAYAKRDSEVYSQMLPIGVSELSAEMTLKVRYPEEVKDDKLLIIDAVESGHWIVDYTE